MKEKLFLLWIVCFLTTTLSANETNDTMVPVDQELYSEKREGSGVAGHYKDRECRT